MAPMLVEDEVIVRENPPASEQRQASPEQGPDADTPSTPDRKDPRRG
jgi:hypothetical protein